MIEVSVILCYSRRCVLCESSCVVCVSCLLFYFCAGLYQVDTESLQDSCRREAKQVLHLKNPGFEKVETLLRFVHFYL